MKTKLNKVILILATFASISSAHAEQSLVDRISKALNERHSSVRTPTAVAGVRG